MKSKCSFVLKATTALVLCLLLLFGTVATSLAAVVDNADTGAEADVAETGATERIVYFTPYASGSDGNGWIKDNKTIGARYNKKGDGDWWDSQTGSDTGRTIGGKRVYQVSLWDEYGGLGNLYFRHDDLENTTDNEIHPFSSWTGQATFAGKYWNGSSWATPSYDTFSVRNNGTSVTNLTFSSTTKKYTGSATLNKGTTYKLNIYDGGRYWANNSAGTLSATGSKTMYRYGSGGSSDGISITPAVTGTYSFEWTLNAAGNREDAGSFKVSFPTTYTVSYNANGHGTAPSSEVVVSGGKATKPTDPTATGWVFGGWYKESSCTNAWNFSTDTVTSDKTLYAKWTAATTPSIDTFTIDDGSSKTLNIGETATLASTTSNTSNSVTYSTTSDAISISGTTVTALKPVTSATITATLVDGSTYTKTVTVKVNTPTVSLTTTSAQSLNVNQTHTNTATGSTIGSAATGTISYSVGGSTNISVNSSGEVTGLKPTSTAQTMTATYTVTCGGQTTTATKTCNYTVKTPVLTNSAATSMNVDATQTLSASVTNTTGTPTYTWTVTNGTGTASLSSGTTLKALTPGTVTATVTAKFNDSYSLTKDATITIATPTITASGITVAKGNSKSISASTSNPSGLTLAYALKTAVSGVSISGNTVSVTQGCTASSATVTVSAKNSAGTVVATKDVTVNIAAPSMSIKEGSTTILNNGTVYTTKGTNTDLTVSPNFSDTLYVKSADESIATVAISGSGSTRTLTITPKAKGTTKVSVSTSNSVSPTSANLATTAAILPKGMISTKVFEIASTGAVATQTQYLTVNVAEPDTYGYLFFTNGANISSPKVYLWNSDDTDTNNGTYPGETMVKVGVNKQNKDVYAIRYLKTKGYDRAIIGNGGTNAADKVKVNNTQDIVLSTTNNAIWCDALNDNSKAGWWNCTIVKPQIQADNVTIDMGSTKTMTATVLTSGTPSTFNWSSGTTSVATTANTHTATNVITGVDQGTSTITIKAYSQFPGDFNSIVTDGTADDYVAGTTTATATVTAEDKTITNSGAYHKTGSADYVSGNTGGTFTVSNTGSLAYNTNLTLTATAASGYAVEGIYWSTDGTTWTKVETTDTTTNGIITQSINDSFKVINNYSLKANFVQVLKLSAFDSYEMKNNQVTFVTAPPKSITIKHTDAHGDATTYTYSYDGTATPGNENTPGISEPKPAALPIASGKYGQGNYIQYYAGDEITMTYSAMASSEILKGVFFDNSKNFYVTKPTQGQFVAHSHPTTPAIYMNSAYYTTGQLNGRTFTDVTADNDAHSIKFTGTQDYKNIDVEIGTKRKVYFSDYTNAVITSKNVDDYYYDGEDLSVEGDQLKVAAAKSDTQTNTIDATKIKFYKANSDGTKGVEVDKTTLGITITGSTSSSTQETPSALVFNGNMPAYDLYIDLNMENSYTIKLGTKIVSDLGGNATRLASKATVMINTLSALSDADVTTNSTSVATGTTATLSVTNLTSGYMFVGWYWGDASGPDYNKGFISDKQSLSYAPKKGGIIWAVGTKDLFINGSKYITGKDTDWYAEGNTQKNLEMKFEASTGRYYWEITDTMFAAAGSDFKTWGNQAWGTATTAYGTYNKGDNGSYYWTASEDKYHGKSYFQFLDSETGNDNKSIWNQLTSFTVDTPANGPTYGKIYPTNATDSEGTWNGQGFINFNESGYPGYSSPLRIYYDPNASGNAKLTVEATPIHSNLYVSNGYDVGSTLKTDAVTVQPVVDGVVKTSGQTGYFNVKSEGSGWNPDAEGHVQLYIPQKKGATVRITKQAGGSDKIAAFLIYDIDNRTVRAERNLTKGTTVSNKTPYYFDLTLANERQNLYIVPIVEEAGAKVTITFDATQLNRAQWGDIVTAYTWYTGTNNNGLGAYPGQPMIPSDDMSTWTTTFAATKGGNELTGITFTNYVDGIHSWLGCSGVMGEVSDHTTGTATGGIINVYNHVDSGTNGEYSRTNYKAQTYDYHEPIALYDRYSKTDDNVSITFQMKDGNSSLISWRHTEFAPENIISGTWGHTLNWEYLTNAKGDQYIDMNGNPLGANNKPTATFYVASKGQVVYNDSRMDYVFHGGHNYQMKGYDAAYSDPTGGADRGSYTRTALPSGQWSSDITYGGAADLDMKYAVQWYVYDAQGNYITTVLSAGIADLSSNNTDTYIAKQLEDLGYAVDGKSVAICYDKPRYMYGDWTVTNSAQNINSGPNFDAYRFEGQWIAAAQTDTVKVHVGVGMMTDSGEVLADSNTAAYGNASASLVSGVNFGKPNYAITANDGSWAQTAASDAKLNGIALNASATNFIGWYYYDANTGEFTKATYASNEGFRPNYTNKDVTYYAIYRAAAVYNYIYQGREGERIYSAAGEDLKDAEMVDNKVIYANHSEDILAKLPVGIGIFKKNIDFSAANVASWTQDNNTQYIFKLSGFSVTSPEYTLTAHYKDASGQLQTTTKTSVYNGGAVNLTTLNGGTAVTTLYDKKFLGWYAYDNGEKGDLLSTQANYGLQLTRDQAVIAVYEEDNNTLPTDGWSVHIDENEVNKELTTKDTGVFYNDTIVRVRKSSDVKAELPTGAKIGVLVVCDNKTGNAINGYSDGNLNTLVKAVASGKTMKTSSGLSITNMQASSQTSFNRTDIAVRADYAKNLGAKYCVYAYFFDGSAYHFSAVSDVKTYV